MIKKILFILLIFASACSPAATTATEIATPSVVHVYSTFATQSWQTTLFKCAAEKSIVLVTDDVGSAEIALRMGEPNSLSSPAFQLGWEEILVIVNKGHTFQQLRTEQVAGLFTGQISDWSQVSADETGPVQVWVFTKDDDAQEVFAKTLSGKPITSSARVATSPKEMSEAIANDPSAVGIVSRRWKTENTSDVYVAASAPILAIAPTEPQGAVKDLLACLQG